MALLITDECINCGACLPECPNEAIFETRGDAETKGNHVGDGQGVGMLGTQVVTVRLHVGGQRAEHRGGVTVDVGEGVDRRMLACGA